MFTESQLLPISALQHLAFCPRQWGLIHLEQVWTENRLTVEGNILHEKVHESDSESRGDLRITRSLRLHNFRLGLVGQADVVEFYRLPEGENDVVGRDGVSEYTVLTNAPGRWRVLPVEYKRGKPKKDRCDEVQLCAQALCLEEMLNVHIPAGALFYGKPRRRHEVLFAPSLRDKTEAMAKQLHELTLAGITPLARYMKKCDNCSLIMHCMPKITGMNKKVAQYIHKNIQNETIT